MLEINKKYQVMDRELKGYEVTYDGNHYNITPYTPFVIMDSNDVLIFLGNNFLHIDTTQVAVSIFQVKTPKGSWPSTALVAFDKGVEKHLVVIN